MRQTRSLGWLLAGLLLLTACSPFGGQGSSSKGAELARAAFKPIPPAAQLSDQEFEALVANAGLRKAFGQRADEIIGQLKRSRIAVVPQPNPPKASENQMVLVAALEREYLSLMNGFFGFILEGALDPFTRGQGGGGQIPPSTTTATEEGPTARTTTSLTSAGDLSATGSRVQLTLHWTWGMKTVDKASGAALVEMVDDRTLKGAIDVCPSAAGIMAASLSADQQFGSTGTGGARSRRDLRSNTFSGHVDGQAVLTSVTQELKDESSWESSSGDRGSFDVSASQGWQGDSFKSTGGVAQLSYGLKGDAKDADVAGQLGLSNGLDYVSIQSAIQEAQRLWRHGRCVVVTAPDYNAETPISVADQEKMQHDETVDKGSVTKFSTNVRHRFGGGLSQPVTAKLTSGAKKLEPLYVGSVPGKLSYTAPDEADKKATVELKSISRRGIGTLVLGFNTGAPRLKIEIKGTVRFPGGLVVLAADETIGPVEFAKKDDTTSDANAPFQGNIRLEPFPGNPCPNLGSETGSAYLTATIDKRGDTSVWVVRLGELSRSQVNLTVTCRDASFQALINSAGYAVVMLRVAGDIVIPIDGGTVPVHASSTTTTVDATVTATVTKK